MALPQLIDLMFAEEGMEQLLLIVVDPDVDGGAPEALVVAKSSSCKMSKKMNVSVDTLQ